MIYTNVFSIYIINFFRKKRLFLDYFVTISNTTTKGEKH